MARLLPKMKLPVIKKPVVKLPVVNLPAVVKKIAPKVSAPVQNVMKSISAQRITGAIQTATKKVGANANATKAKIAQKVGNIGNRLKTAASTIQKKAADVREKTKKRVSEGVSKMKAGVQTAIQKGKERREAFREKTKEAFQNMGNKFKDGFEKLKEKLKIPGLENIKKFLDPANIKKVLIAALVIIGGGAGIYFLGPIVGPALKGMSAARKGISKGAQRISGALGG